MKGRDTYGRIYRRSSGYRTLFFQFAGRRGADPYRVNSAFRIFAIGAENLSKKFSTFLFFLLTNAQEGYIIKELKLLL